MSIQLCLFDLDNTLLRTDGLERFLGCDRANQLGDRAYTHELLDAFNNHYGRLLYTQEDLEALQEQYPYMCLGVFTQSSPQYATTLLKHAYPEIKWDVVAVSKDIHEAWPRPEVIELAAQRTGVRRRDEVALVGDQMTDISCAYQAGCWAFLDTSSWETRVRDNWNALSLIPDALIEGADELRQLLASPYLGTPELEYLVSGMRHKDRRLRVDKINHFFPNEIGGGPVPIHILGRLFTEYKSIRYRREWHALTNQILAHKDAIEFPTTWIDSILNFVRKDVATRSDTIVTVVPFKPGRTPRLERMLEQLSWAYIFHPEFTGQEVPPLVFAPDVLAFRPGAISSHKNYLSRDQRFANTGKNLYVNRPQEVRGKHVIVIDDVTTTGATLLYAHRHLIEAGARTVSCLSLSKAISASAKA